jgi:hypothetical protein
LDERDAARWTAKGILLSGELGQHVVDLTLGDVPAQDAGGSRGQHGSHD